MKVYNRDRSKHCYYVLKIRTFIDAIIAMQKRRWENKTNYRYLRPVRLPAGSNSTHEAFFQTEVS